MHTTPLPACLPSEEPRIRVGLREDTARLRISATAPFLANGAACGPGDYDAARARDTVTLSTAAGIVASAPTGIRLEPLHQSTMTVHDMPIGRSFHWERSQQQTFRGALLIEAADSGSIRLVNDIPLELYLKSVISSEMSPDSPPEFLKAHCIVSRSWLLAQLIGKQRQGPEASQARDRSWTDAKAHQHFDVCNDDHCQRYHGVGRVNEAARQALEATRGQVLVYNKDICDARFSKCCGGITERFATAWEDRDVPYLQPVADCGEFVPPLAGEAVERFIRSVPAAYCNMSDQALRARILPDFDCETQHFFRWRISVRQEELRDILLSKTGIDFGDILALTPLARGASGRIYALKVCGTKKELVFGKELEIRRILSRSHLYSSAFIVEAHRTRAQAPESFTLIGAGWGHGVGMCQIGAAAMAVQGKECTDILRHYFTGTRIQKLYP